MARSVSATVDRSLSATSSRGRFAASCEQFLGGLVALTFFVRFYLPTEDAANGATLWVVAVWFVIGLFTLLSAWRVGGVARRFDGCDASVLLLIGGQVVSTVTVVATTGDKRAAVNMAWEWIGAGIVWFVLRSRRGGSSFRAAFLRASVVTGCVLAGLGLWQHYVSQPALVREYGPLFDRLRAATGGEVEAIQRTLAKAGVPTDGPALTLFEKRMRDSREPMGLFGLTNTFGGCLAVWLMLALASFHRLSNAPRGQQQRFHFVFAVASVALIAWCLLLTKSRTAVLGTVCGIAVLAGGRLLSSLRGGDAITPWIRRAVSFTGIGGLVAGIVVAVLIQSGGLDIEVLSEAPKSVSYRLQYWQATSRLVAAHPWFGVGPGNFRQHYLRYKLPEASEEIADPHNLFFDLAATGGVVSLAGLVMLIALTICTRVTVQHEQLHLRLCPEKRISRAALAPVLDKTTGASALRLIYGTEPRDFETNSASSWPFWCAGAAPLLVFFSLMVLNGEWDDRLIVLPGVWFCVAGVWCWLADKGTSVLPDVGRWAFAAAVVLIVHLLGAGGISMPAVSQLLLCLIAFSLPPRSVPDAANVEALSSETASATLGSLINHRVCSHGPMRAVALIGWTVTVAAFVATALVPATQSQSWLATGNRLAIAREGRSGAEAAYRAACLADDWSSTPWHRRAELAYEQAARDRFRSNELFDTAVKLLLEAMARDPHNFHGPQTLGNWWLARWQVTQHDNDAQQAFEWLQRASDSYPTNASLLAELSQAATAASQLAEGTAAAQRALNQNELNRRLGHVDRYLADDVVARLLQLEETPRSP